MARKKRGPRSIEASFRRALANVGQHGDTDVFPFPIEKWAFLDLPDESLDLLTKIHADFDDALSETPVTYEQSLAAVGYNGFRWVTQIDPLWNAYLLALVIEIGAEIESARLPLERRAAFSYRFLSDPEESRLFDREVGWTEFQECALELSYEYSHVLVCDISDFYPRVYHHRLENGLKQATPKTEVIGRIMALLKILAKGASYGLPVGGPAARLLSELLLNRVDRLLTAAGIRFCRFADDYRLFARSEEEAYSHLILLSEVLLANEGLLLQKAKTRIVGAKEFQATSRLGEEVEELEADEAATRTFLSLRLRFDPYSPTAEEDYEALKEEIRRCNVISMLGRELQKSRVHQTLMKRMIHCVELFEEQARDQAVVSLMSNLPVLYPVFSSVMILVRSVIGEVADEAREHVFETLRTLVGEQSYITRVPVHLGFAIRVLARDPSDETDAILDRVYREVPSPMIRRDVILAMARRERDYWVADRRHNFQSLSVWERRALIIASYILADEGKHFRSANERHFGPLDWLVRTWSSRKKDANRWSVPL